MKNNQQQLINVVIGNLDVILDGLEFDQSDEERLERLKYLIEASKAVSALELTTP